MRTIPSAIPWAIFALLCTPATAKTVNITYWGAWSGIYAEIEKGIVDRFNKQYEGRIHVNVTPDGSWGTGAKIMSAIAAGSPPDLFKINRFEIGSYAAKNLIMPLDQYIKRDKIKPDLFFKGPWDESIWGGKVYGIPWNTDDRALYYNKNLFKQIGLDPELSPASWEEVQNASRKIDLIQNGKLIRAGLIPHNGDWYFIGWLWSAGGNIIDDAGKKCIWNSPAGLKALTFMADTIKKYGGIGKIGGAADFWGGKAGMEINGSWMLGEWRKNKNKKFDLGVGAPPRPAGLEKDKMTWGAGFGMTIPKGSKHPAEAWTFIKYYCMSKEAQLALGVPSGQIPTLKVAANDDKFLSSDPFMKWFVNLMPYAHHLPVLPVGPELWDLYSVAVTNQLTAGKKSPRDILDSTVAEAQKILDRGWKRVRQY